MDPSGLQNRLVEWVIDCAYSVPIAQGSRKRWLKQKLGDQVLSEFEERFFLLHSKAIPTIRIMKKKPAMAIGIYVVLLTYDGVGVGAGKYVLNSL